jgi:hypothetical protein
MSASEFGTMRKKKVDDDEKRSQETASRADELNVLAVELHAQDAPRIAWSRSPKRWQCGVFSSQKAQVNGRLNAIATRFAFVLRDTFILRSREGHEGEP